jgi:hypothetical protein
VSSVITRSWEQDPIAITIGPTHCAYKGAEAEEAWLLTISMLHCNLICGTPKQ